MSGLGSVGAVRSPHSLASFSMGTRIICPRGSWPRVYAGGGERPWKQDAGHYAAFTHSPPHCAKPWASGWPPGGLGAAWEAEL